MIYLGADHGGFNLKEKIKNWLSQSGLKYEDIGNKIFEPEDDYPLYSLVVAKKVSEDPSSFGIIIGRSGNGEAIIANKVKGIRAAVCLNEEMAKKAREHNNSNILSLGADYIKENKAQKIIEVFIKTSFSNEERHIRRVEQIKRFEKGTIEVIPGILEKHLSDIQEKINLVQDYVSWIHIDIADGTFFATKTFIDFGPSSLNTNVHLEAHLMVKNPVKYIAQLTEAGFTRLSAPIETLKPEQFIKEARKIRPKPEVGLAIDLSTNPKKILPFLDKVDFILVMSVKAGKSGQSFQIESLKKITTIKKLNPNLLIAVDGGINNIFAPVVRAAGASRIISNSYIFKSNNIQKAIESLKKW